jgi:type IV fimbrial biogenesis protein FimT
MRRSLGYTLVELATCVAVAAILLAVAGPPLSRLMAEARLLNGLHAMTSSLALARLAAVSEGVPVTVCPSADGRTCRLDLTWDAGWIVYRDPRRQPQPTSADALLLHQQAPSGNLRIRSSIGRHRVRYQPSGLSGGNNLTLRVCIGDPARHAGNVVVNLAGRPRTRRIPGAWPPCPFPP